MSERLSSERLAEIRQNAGSGRVVGVLRTVRELLAEVDAMQADSDQRSASVITLSEQLADARRAGAEQGWDEGADWAMAASGQFTGDPPNPHRADETAQDQP